MGSLKLPFFSRCCGFLRVSNSNRTCFDSKWELLTQFFQAPECKRKINMKESMYTDKERKVLLACHDRVDNTYIIRNLNISKIWQNVSKKFCKLQGELSREDNKKCDLRWAEVPPTSSSTCSSSLILASHKLWERWRRERLYRLLSCSFVISTSKRKAMHRALLIWRPKKAFTPSRAIGTIKFLADTAKPVHMGDLFWVVLSELHSRESPLLFKDGLKLQGIIRM